jgi:hypothetical protein
MYMSKSTGVSFIVIFSGITLPRRRNSISVFLSSKAFNDFLCILNEINGIIRGKMGRDCHISLVTEIYKKIINTISDMIKTINIISSKPNRKSLFLYFLFSIF